MFSADSKSSVRFKYSTTPWARPGGSREFLDSRSMKTRSSWCVCQGARKLITKGDCKTCIKNRKELRIIREKEFRESEEKERKNSIHYKFAQARKKELALSKCYTASTGNEYAKLKGSGQYCTYHHSFYDEKRCTCERNREGFLTWYASYDKTKHCVRCNSLICDCGRTKEGEIVKKIVVKEIYEQEYGKCQLHSKTNCDCADSVKCIITETFDGKDIHKYCTLHKDVGCDCDKHPEFYKIIKQVPGAAWEYDKSS